MKDGYTAKGIYFKQQGDPSSPALVLVMGYAGSSDAWPMRFLSRLEKSFQLITLDNLGTGRSPQPREATAYSVAGMADDVAEVVEAAGLRDFHLLGYSLGGCIALEYAMRPRARAPRSLVLMSTTAGGKLYVSPGEATLSALATPRGETLWDLFLSTWRLCFSPEGLARHDAELREIFEQAAARLTPRRAMLGQLKAYREFDSTGDIGQIAVPTLVLTGEGDRLAPAENSRALARLIRGSQLLELPGVEHAPHIEAREVVARALEEFCLTPSRARRT